MPPRRRKGVSVLRIRRMSRGVLQNGLPIFAFLRGSFVTRIVR